MIEREDAVVGGRRAIADVMHTEAHGHLVYVGSNMPNGTVLLSLADARTLADELRTLIGQVEEGVVDAEQPTRRARRGLFRLSVIAATTSTIAVSTRSATDRRRA